MRKKIISAAISILMLVSVFLPVSAAGTFQPVSSPSYRVIDISHYNTVTDWPAVKSSVDAVYIKATEGVTYTDPAFKSNVQGAESVGISKGFYQFFWPWAGSQGEFKARQEADSFYKAISAYDYQLIPVIDVEEVNGCTAQEITDGVNAFCDELVRVDGAPNVIVYSYSNFIKFYLESKLSKYPLWIAQYGVSVPSAVPTWSSWAMWQYADNGSIAGISGRVDLDSATADIFLDSANVPQKAAEKPKAALTKDKTVLAYQQKLNRIRIPRPLLTEDGKNGPKTRAAVRTLERIEGLKVDSGIWGRQCNAAYSAITARPMLRQESTEQPVRYIQYRLGIPYDGKFGPQTLKYVKVYQKSHGLYPDGIVGRLTWRTLGVE